MLTTVLCRMKSDECDRKMSFEIGFVDPSLVNQKMFTLKYEETVDNLFRALREQHYKGQILFPYHFR